MVRRLIILALLVSGFWWYWSRWRPAHNYKQLSNQLENAVNQELARSGVTDKDVLQNVHRERSRWGLRWIESNRRLQLASRNIPGIQDALARRANKLGCTVLKREKTILELGKGPFLMQRLEFVQVASPARTQPQVAIVIDDVAYDLTPMDHFAALGVTLTFAILPRDKNCKALAEKAVQLNFPVMIHMPMEPLDLVHNNPGSAGLYLNMTTEQLHQQFEKNLASIPHIQGINNHMGSAFTQDADKMRSVMQWVKEKDLFFLDSHTSPHSVVPRIAKEVGVPCLVNETFLDNEDETAAIAKQLDIVLKLALKRGRTIAIGHYRRKHLVEALAQKLPEFKAKGVTLVGLPTFYSQ